MVKVRPPIFLLWAVALAHANGQAPDAAEEHSWNITAECQMVIVPQKAALSLLSELLDEGRCDAAYGKLQKMIEAGQAELAAQLVARTTNNDRAVAETIEESRYATEFDPPSVPANSEENPKILKEWPIIGITPTSFETRNIGSTLEITVEVRSQSNWLYVTAVPQHVRFLRWAKTDAGKLANGEHLYVEQPIFHTMRNKSEFYLKNGQRVLLGAHKVPERPDQMELFLLRVEAKSASAK
jgi:hypothetical protein